MSAPAAPSPSSSTARARIAPALRAHALLASLLGAACSGAQPPPLPPPKVDPTPPPPPPPPAARWIEGGGATVVGPVVGDSTLVLIGGRRALVGKDGAVKMQTAETAEPIQEIVEVPGPQGVRTVGRGEHGIYRFDDPLGEAKALAHTDATI